MDSIKKISLFVCCMFLVSILSAQSTIIDTVPPYKRTLTIPDFTIQLADSTWFTKDQLPKSAFTAIINFDPECGHCQNTMKEITLAMDSLKNVFFVFVAYKPIPQIREFYKYYGLEKFSNIRMGRDPKYFVPSFFRVTANPFAAVYDKDGKLVRVFDPASNTTIEVPELVAFVNKK
jgi:thiol-disulfide isomerase/thioredoxin